MSPKQSKRKTKPVSATGSRSTPATAEQAANGQSSEKLGPTKKPDPGGRVKMHTNKTYL